MLILPDVSVIVFLLHSWMAMIGSPSEISLKQLKELGIKLSSWLWASYMLFCGVDVLLLPWRISPH